MSLRSGELYTVGIRASQTLIPRLRAAMAAQLLIVDRANNYYPSKWCARTFSINDLPTRSGGGYSCRISMHRFQRHGFRNRKTSPLAKSIQPLRL